MFVAKRLGTTLITLFLVSVLTFAAFRIIPGDAAVLALGTEASAEQLAALRTEMGLDRSLGAQYSSWLKNFFTGNLGNSSRFRGQAISAMILDRLPVTAALAILSLIFILIIAFPAALLPSHREGSFPDRLTNSLTAVNISFPGFFLAVLFIWIFGILLKLFSPGGYTGYRDNFSAFLGYLVFPALAIALPNAAILVKFLRSSISQQLRSDYVRTARSKGASERIILYRHVLKNGIIPSVTVMGMIVAEIFSGSIVIEQVFSIPGIGRLLIASITSRDYPLVQTLVIYIAFVVIFANTLADIAVRIIDPRIRIRSGAAE
ncbi:MAG: ABC transporter permease [Treponema sp.]|jgi:ABC-type dipeptide/oligopeptide/nickel transport system permease component|nr:ABC transporter permease [Treponema sp.]